MGVLAAALTSIATGCATVSYSTPGKLNGVTVKGIEGKRAERMVVISTSGYYVFWTIPLVSGDLRWDSSMRSIRGGFSLFDDQVGINELQEALFKVAETHNCDLADVHYVDSDSSYAGVTDVGSMIGTIFGSSDMSVSALLVPRNQAK